MNIAEEICRHCGHQISNSEQAYVFRGEIVCRHCDHKLRQQTNDNAVVSEAESTNSTIELQEVADYAFVKRATRWPAVGSIVIGLILIWIGLRSAQYVISAVGFLFIVHGD